MIRRLTHLFTLVLIGFALIGLAPLGGATATAQAADDDPTIGTAVAYEAKNGDELARITIEEIVDPFEDYGRDAEPPRGEHYILVRLTIANTGEDDLEVDPLAFLIEDDGEEFYSSEDVDLGTTEEALLEAQDLPAGERVEGSIPYLAPDEAALTRVLFNPTRTRFVTLAALSAGPTPNAGGDCDGIDAWLEVTQEHIAITDDLSLQMSLSVDLGPFQYASMEYPRMAEAQRALDVPPAAADVNEALATVLETAGQVIGDYVDGVLSNNRYQANRAIQQFPKVSAEYSGVKYQVDQVERACFGH